MSVQKSEIKLDANGKPFQAYLVAAEIGIRRLYLYTESARGLYLKLGSQALEEDFYEGYAITIMSYDIPTVETQDIASGPN